MPVDAPGLGGTRRPPTLWVQQPPHPSHGTPHLPSPSRMPPARRAPRANRCPFPGAAPGATAGAGPGATAEGPGTSRLCRRPQPLGLSLSLFLPRFPLPRRRCLPPLTVALPPRPVQPPLGGPDPPKKNPPPKHPPSPLCPTTPRPHLSGFTSDPREVCSCLYDLETVVCKSFSIPPLVGQQKIELPVTENVQTIPPPYVVRTILVFGRPGCQPQFSMSEHMKKMLQCPYFFFDVVYIHNGVEEKDDETSWKEMYVFFSSLDSKGTNYKYEVSLSGPAVELHNCMAKLLAHPLQRPFQPHAAYGLLGDDEPPEVEATV
uniref:BABA1 protein n=1 Tax=Calidris pygmaea TaxID=425635 RepID=A0A8C3K7A3_9CHAR